MQIMASHRQSHNAIQHSKHINAKFKQRAVQLCSRKGARLQSIIAMNTDTWNISPNNIMVIMTSQKQVGLTVHSAQPFGWLHIIEDIDKCQENHSSELLVWNSQSENENTEGSTTTWIFSHSTNFKDIDKFRFINATKLEHSIVSEATTIIILLY